MPSIGPMELLVVAIIALIVFGPRRLPEIARSVGKAFSEFKRQASEVRDEFESSLNANPEDEPPPVNAPSSRSRRIPEGTEPAEKDPPDSTDG